MKPSVKNVLIVLMTFVIGGAAGAYFFGESSAAMSKDTANQHDVNEATGQIWTCSMHPQIRQQEPGDCPICGMDLIPVSENNGSDDPTILEMTESAVQLAQIETTIIGDAAAANGKKIPLSGKVQADERRASTQVTHLAGRIEKLYVSFTGEEVTAGQKLADIYAPELIAAQKELLEAIKLQDINPSLLEAARNKLRFWKIGNTFIQNIEANGSVQETFSLYADGSGTVTNKHVSVGDYVRQGEPLFDLVNLSKVWVLFDVYEEDLGQVRVGDYIEFTAASTANKTFKARVDFIDPLLNPKTRTASLRTVVSNASRMLKPEMFVQGFLQKKTRKSKSETALTVPKSAVLWTGKRSVVYVQKTEAEIPTFQFREVEIGDALGDVYQVLKGLSVGETVVTQGNFSLDAAAQLNNQASMMNRNVKVKQEKTNEVPNFKAQATQKLQKQLLAVVESYLILKDALVATDAVSAGKAVEHVLDKLGEIHMAPLKGEAHLFWMEKAEALMAHAKAIQTSTDVATQREQFSFLSSALIESVQAFGVDSETLYVQYCPMALENAGADWISKNEAIKNPYFGDKMMKCGSVKSKIES